MKGVDLSKSAGLLAHLDDDAWEGFFEIFEGLANSGEIQVSSQAVQVLTKLFQVNTAVLDRHAYDEVDNLRDLNIGNLIWYAMEHEEDPGLLKTECFKTYTDFIWTVLISCYQLSLEKMDLLRQSLIKTRQMIDKVGTEQSQNTTSKVKALSEQLQALQEKLEEVENQKQAPVDDGKHLSIS